MNIIIEDKTPQPELTEDVIKFMVNSRNDNLRKQRNLLLEQSDKYLLSDFPITPENLELIKEYRQKLRDFMNTKDIELPDFPLFQAP